jgi:predicted metalloprotease
MMPRGRVARGATIGGGTALLLVVISLLLGQDPTAVLEIVGGTSPAARAPAPAAPPPGEDVATDFVAAVLGDTEDTWGPIFSSSGRQYRPPTLVLYTDAVQSACGFNSAATGPFYCPADGKVYLDLGFLRELQRLGAPGDFAFAYVIAHEVGHHIQAILGIERQVRDMQMRAGQRDANALSVRMELQADCFAGVWAHHAEARRDLLEAGDLEEGLRAAAAVGDDRLQSMAGQRIQPESFTHGSSEQRMRWFRIGFDSGDMQRCDTFGTGG